MELVHRDTPWLPSCPRERVLAAVFPAAFIIFAKSSLPPQARVGLVGTPS
jgi:hypothetical protein